MKRLWATGSFAVAMIAFGAQAISAEMSAVKRGTFRSASTAVKFDVSPPLRDIPILPPPPNDVSFFAEMLDDWEFPEKQGYGPQSIDRSVQGSHSILAMPAPIMNFNVGTGTANPPDPVGDVGPNHYVRMSNLQFQIFNKTTGASVFGPANINTLFSGFGGPCQDENAGDPIVLYDQFADRWLLTQFSDSAGPGFFNCVALSTSSDPTGTYFRWAFSTAVFPDYPKYGVWPNAYLISTRELSANSVIGAYAIDRTQMIAGVAAPTMVQFTVPVNEFSGDGLLPADLDGSTLPPSGAPAYYIGSMDDGGPYGAARDALSLWEFNINFVTPASSTFQLVNTIPISAYDTIYPCALGNARSCIPQPPPLNPVDILSYRQRPMNRAAYRNFGSYQSIVTNQSVEAAPALAGVRWWEIRNPGANAVLYQDSTYAPGVTDGIQRWMASIAQDRSGNMAMGYSASSSTVFPSILYTGRLERDPVNSMAQGEGTFVTGTAGRTGTSIRWGDYTSMNIDSTDDCTFWYINEFFAATGTAWTLRAGSFKFPDCGLPNLGVAVVPLNNRVCTPASATFNVEAHGYDGFTSATALSISGVPAGATSSFSATNISPVPGSSTLTIGNTSAVTAGSYPLTITGTSASPVLVRPRTVNLVLDSAVPLAPALTLPADGATGVSVGPVLSWAPSAQGQTYIAEVATDAAFTNIVFTSPATTDTSTMVTSPLAPDTNFFWRVRSSNTCGAGLNSTASQFRTRLGPNTCPAAQQVFTGFSDNMESGVNGWTTVPTSGTTWTRSTARPSSGMFSWLAVDVDLASLQRLISPPIFIPSDLNSQLLRFRHDVTMEPDTTTSCFDGGLVEISTNNGSSWTVLGSTTQVEDYYTGTLSGTSENVWCGTRPYRDASFDMAPYSGQTVRFRFTAVTDGSVGSAPHGWYVDDVRIEGCALPVNVFANGFE